MSLQLCLRPRLNRDGPDWLHLDGFPSILRREYSCNVSSRKRIRKHSSRLHLSILSSNTPLSNARHKGTTQREGKLFRVRERCYMPLFTGQPKDSHSPNLKFLTPSGANRQRNINLCLLCITLCGIGQSLDEYPRFFFRRFENNLRISNEK